MEHLHSSQQSQSVAGLEGQKPLSEENVTAITPTNSNRDTKKTVAPSKRHRLPKLVLGVLLASGAIASGTYAYRWWNYNQQYATKFQQTDNAYVTANISSITSRVSGIVTEVAVNDNQIVSPKDILVKLDNGDYQVSLTQAKASLELAKQQAELARENLISASELKPPRVVNKNNQAKQTVNTDKILQVSTLSRQRQQQYKTALATVAQKQADVKKAELQLSYTNITALVPGKVGNKNISVGQQVQPGQTLITIVQPNPWIIANFKETQLEKIQPGQNVTIKIAAFPNRKFRGKVDSMSATSFGKVALPPQDNATSSSTLTQDVQRIPVKIVFEPESIQGYESRMTPGMSAVAVVETNDSLPAQKTPNVTNCVGEACPKDIDAKSTKEEKKEDSNLKQEGQPGRL
ncbi:HlyD family secretion protein [Brasilonema sp. UFV-L1]|uniref:HlyD family secretion protein n=1 Tax=Brasilonema sp. UFV-L1 TaxID=2234130 RepID=UPI00145CDBE4|nr:HlyD family secretion protein [Brasilonema sp. UFV-L1]NMG08522.1 HlyD family secretion protein [Brasilonema sp. UFV-L1]